MSKFLSGVEMDEPIDISSDNKKPKASSPFIYLDYLTDQKVPLSEVNLGGYEPFITNRQLSMNPDTCELALLATCTRNLTNEDHYRLMLSALPRKRMYIKWLNRKGVDETKADMTAVMTMLECGHNDALAMINLLPITDLDRIKETHKTLLKLRNRYE